jgi:surface-anchored protein
MDKGARKVQKSGRVVAICGAIAAAMTAPAADAAAVTLSDGHVDAGSARVVGSSLRAYVKDATRGSNRVRWLDSSRVVLHVNSRARTRLPRNGNLNFVGGPGQTVWMIPQVQRRGVIWAGWNTQEISSRQVRSAITWQLRRVSGPGRVVLWTTGSFGDASEWFNSARRLPQSHAIALGTHVHTNWAFTRRGTYRLSFALTATSRAGRRLSASQTMTLRVG